MYKKSYKPCVHCNREIVTSRLKDHESKCLRMQEKAKITKKPVGHQRGAAAWNKGLTKDSDVRVKNLCDSVSKTIRKQVLDGVYVPRRMGERARQELSERQSLQNSGGRCKWYEIDGITVQGTWELNVAKELNNRGIRWIRSKKKEFIFKYNDSGKTKSYCPDFYLPEYNLYLEIKGYWWGNDREKMRLVKEQHLDKKILIIEKDLYDKFLEGKQIW